MKTSAKLCILLIYAIILILIEGSHFNGGTITYKVLKMYGSIVSISVTQTYHYTHSVVHCNDTMIADRSTTLSQNSAMVDRTVTLSCTLYCNQSDGYKPIPVDSFCIDYSKTLDITVGQRSDEINITSGSYFRITFASLAWRKLTLPKGLSSSGGWSLACLINLRLRSNGTYNQPPVATMISPMYMPVGNLQAIYIPTIDADNDDVRCRTANGSDECGDVCYPLSLPNGTKLLPNCTLLITGANVGDWYAVAIMIEDFANSTSTDPLSSIPVQFLINVQKTTTCRSPYLTGPVANSGQCVGVLVGEPFIIQLTVEHFCSNSTIIKDIAIVSFPNVIKTPIVQNTTSIWSISLIWTPTEEQVGSQVLCAIAIDSNNVQSNQYCITFTVATGSIPSCPGEAVIPTTEFSTTVDSTSQSFQQMSSIPYQKNNSADSVPASSSPSGSDSLWRWRAPLIAVLATCIIAFCIWCCCCYPLCCCFTRRRKRSSSNNIIQQQNIIRRPSSTYRVYKVFENDQDSNNNVHKVHSSDDHTSKMAPTSISLPLNNIQHHTSTSVTKAYMFGRQDVLKIKK